MWTKRRALDGPTDHLSDVGAACYCEACHSVRLVAELRSEEDQAVTDSVPVVWALQSTDMCQTCAALVLTLPCLREPSWSHDTPF